MVVELRQYTLHPGKRDVLIDLFERHFLEGQEDAGMTVIGQFRVLEDPNRFFWLRSFPDMPARAEALAAFYDGPIWAEHRDAANATMIDSDNVLLLHPATPESNFSQDGASRRLIVATIYYLDEPAGEDFLNLFEKRIKPVVTSNGATVLAAFVTDHSANTFPRLPVRENVRVFVWFASFSDEAAYERYAQAMSGDARWLEISQTFALLKNYAPPEVWKLVPTERSRLQ